MNEGPSKEPSESEKTPVESDGTEKREDQKTNSGSDPITSKTQEALDTAYYEARQRWLNEMAYYNVINDD